MKNFNKKTIKHLSYISFVFAKRHNCWSVGCGCYDSDYECTMSSLDRRYACPFEELYPDNVSERIRMFNYYDNKRYKYRFDRKYKKEIKKEVKGKSNARI